MSDFISLDMLGILLQIAQIAILGIGIGIFIFYYQDIPILPRKYWKVVIKREGEDGTKKVIRETKGWMVKKKGGIPFFRVLLVGFPSWKGVDLDKSYTKSINTDGELSLIEATPDVREASNFKPEFIPITQYENHLNEMREKLEMNDVALLVYKDIMKKYSRLIDMDESGSMQDFVVTKNAQANRVAGSNLLEKLFPYIALIFIGLFMYLAYDSLSKSFGNAVNKFAEISNYYTQQTVESCGGHFISYVDYVNRTASNSTVKQGNAIPFVNT